MISSVKNVCRCCGADMDDASRRPQFDGATFCGDSCSKIHAMRYCQELRDASVEIYRRFYG